MSTNQPTPPQRVRLCRYCARKLDLWEEWKSNYSLYDHAITQPCEECDGQNLRDPLASFTVRLSLPNTQQGAASHQMTMNTQKTETGDCCPPSTCSEFFDISDIEEVKARTGIEMRGDVGQPFCCGKCMMVKV